MPFQKGQSGNPSGRPKGVGRRVKFLTDLQAAQDRIVDKLLDKVEEGDATTLKFLGEYMMPPKLKPMDLPLPDEAQGYLKDKSFKDQADVVIGLLDRGIVTPDQSKTVLENLMSKAKLVEFDDLNRRVEALEAKQ